MRKVLFVSLITVLLLVLIFFQPVDYRNTESEAAYASRLSLWHSWAPPASVDTVYGAWAQRSIIPPFALPMAGYGDRQGAMHQGVRDSLFVRAFTFFQGQRKMAFLNADLLIIPPLVTEAFWQKAAEKGWEREDIYLTATHTHGGPGAWQPGPIGKLFAGPFDPKLVDFLADQFLLALDAATMDTEPLYLADTTLYLPQFVSNRLVGEAGSIEPRLDLLLLQKAGGQKSIIYTYAAHATTLGPEEMRLHGDYPAAVAAQLGADFELVAYAAGAVGSMGPAKEAEDKEAQLRAMADGLAAAIAISLPALEPQVLQRAIIHRKPLDLGEPQWRITQHIAIRPWLFHRLFGRVNHSLSVFQIGQNVWIGMPADYSGELSVQWPDERRPIFSSFNGSYAGYITEDRHYALDSYETRMMNWYGPGNGQYLQELSVIILDKLKP